VNRKKFIESHGAHCQNWRWSWAFINSDERSIISGAWDLYQKGEVYLILADSWEFHPITGRRSPAYREALEYLKMVENGGYRLSIFQMGHMPIDPAQPLGTARIAHFIPELVDATLDRIEGAWIAKPVNLGWAKGPQ